MSGGPGLGETIANLLGGDAVKRLKAAGVDFTEAPTSSLEKEISLATAQLGSATQVIRDRFSRKDSTGSSAKAVAEPPTAMREAAEKKEVDGGGGSDLKPEKGESMRKLAAKTFPDLPIIKPLPALLAFLEEGKVEEFNAQRPAGRLDLTGINLSKKNLAGIDLRHCELARSNFNGTDLTGALMQYANLDRAILSGTTLTETKLFNAKMNRANLQRVVDARGAQFTTADLSSAEMNDSNFDGANFSDTKLLLANLDHSTFRSAAMSRALLARTTVNHAVFEGALMDEVRLFQSRGRDVSFKDAVLAGAEAVESAFTSSNQKLDDKRTMKTTFEGAWIQDFVHRDAIAPELLANANATGLPPAGLLPKVSEVDKGKILIDGLPGTDKVLYDAAMAELNELIGLKAFKAMIPELLSHLKSSLARERMGLPGFDRKLHYALVGPPGVGKSTCSRILAKIFRSMSLLKEGQVIETDKSGFIAGYAGQSLSKTNELLDDSLGGALIADEIYALTEAKNDDYAKDALVVLVKRLWDDRYKFCAFFLGYPKPMQEFIATNPGFDRRLAGIIELPPNTSGELVEIFKKKMGKLNIAITPEMAAQVSVVMALNKEIKGEKFGNAGTVENFIEDLTKRMSARLDRVGLLNDKKSQSFTVPEDLPILTYAKIPLEKLPPLSELSWVDDAGKSYAFSQIPKDGFFPNLSPESEARVHSLVEKYGLVDINTKH